MNQIVQAPTHLQGNRRQVAAAAVQGMGTLPQPYISIEGGTFTLVDAQGNQMPWQRLGLIPQVTAQAQQIQALCLDAVVVDVNEHMSKSYYVDQWSPNSQRYLPPLCWSDNGLTPSINATTAQSPTCEHCQWNKWGSRINNNNNEVKACDDIKKIAWYVPELQMNLVFLMRLKGSSHKNWRAYVEKVKKHDVMGRAADPVDVVTRIYFEPGQTGIMNFYMVGFIDAQTAAIEDQVWASKSTDTLVGRNDVPRALPAPQQPAAVQQTYLPQPPATAPQPMVQQQPANPGFGGQPQQAQPQHQPQNNAPATAPAGFGGGSPLPQGGSASQGGFGGHAAGQNPAPTAATASPSEALPPSGRPPKQRAPRAPRAPAPNQQPVAQAPQPAQNFGGQPQQFQQPTAPPPQPPNQQPVQQTQAAPAPQNFGIAHGAPLNADLEDALNNAIGT